MSSTKYSGPPFVSEIEDWVRVELNYRAEQRNRPIVPFVKITPGFHVAGTGAPSKPILKGVADFVPGQEPHSFTFEQLYRPSAYSRPLPGVKSVSVEYKNVTGAVRKGTITWACHSLDDMESLAPYFLNPGRTMLIEWGWSTPKAAAQLDTTDKNEGWKLNNYYAKLNVKVGKKAGMVENSSGNYDAMLGIVVNFKFDLNRDGGYDCVTEVTSVGDLMAGINMTQQIATDPMKKKKETPNGMPPPVGSLPPPPPIPEGTIITLRDLIEKYLDAYVKYDISMSTSKDKYVIPRGVAENKDDVYIVEVNGENAADEFVLDDNTTPGNMSGEKDKFKSSIKSEIFISWGYIEDRIINPFLGLFDIKDNPLIWLDSSNSEIGAHPDMRSLNLNVCIVPATNAKGVFPAFDSINKETNILYGNPRKLLINLNMFREDMLSAKTLIDGLGAVLSKVSNATANLWILRIGTYTDIEKEPINAIKDSKDNLGKIPYAIWKVVDLNYSGMGVRNPYIFKTKSYIINKKETRATSIIRNVSLSSKMSNEAALNVYFNGNTDSNTVLGDNNIHAWLYNYELKNNQSYVDDFSNKVIYSPSAAQKPPEEKVVNTSLRTSVRMPEWPRYIKKYLPLTVEGEWLPSGADGAGITVNDLTQARGVMRSCYFGNGNIKQKTAKFEAIVPLECEIELEGVSGVRAGDIFLIDNFPSIYRDKGVFQIINISHEIDKTTWKTKIKAQFRVERSNRGKVDEKLVPNNKSAKEIEMDEKTAETAKAVPPRPRPRPRSYLLDFKD